jgi:hypothetical protein
LQLQSRICVCRHQSLRLQPHVCVYKHIFASTDTCSGTCYFLRLYIYIGVPKRRNGASLFINSVVRFAPLPHKSWLTSQCPHKTSPMLVDLLDDSTYHYYIFQSLRSSSSSFIEDHTPYTTLTFTRRYILSVKPFLRGAFSPTSLLSIGPALLL